VSGLFTRSHRPRARLSPTFLAWCSSIVRLKGFGIVREKEGGTEMLRSSMSGGGARVGSLHKWMPPPPSRAANTRASDRRPPSVSVAQSTSTSSRLMRCRKTMHAHTSNQLKARSTAERPSLALRSASSSTASPSATCALHDPVPRPKSSLRDAATTESVKVESSRASSSMAKGALQLLMTLPLQFALEAMSKHDWNMSVRVMRAMRCGNREVMLCQQRSMGANTADDRPEDS